MKIGFMKAAVLLFVLFAAGGGKNMPELQPAMLYSQMPKEWSVSHETWQLSDQNLIAS